MPRAWDSTIELLAEGEAAWRERAIQVEADRHVWRLLAKAALEALSAVMRERDQARAALRGRRNRVRIPEAA
jgi:hypothetical protein